jgi:hypothetical protein
VKACKGKQHTRTDGRPTAQCSRLKVGYSDDLGTGNRWTFEPQDQQGELAARSESLERIRSQQASRCAGPPRKAGFHTYTVQRLEFTLAAELAGFLEYVCSHCLELRSCLR